jgi:hypothetical protein
MLRPGELIFAIVLTLFAWAFASIKSPASAHDWYPNGCCHELTDHSGDCGPADLIQQLPKGTLFRQRRTNIEVVVPVDFNKRYVNPVDNLYHICVANGVDEGSGAPYTILYCVFEPQGSYRHGRRHLQNAHPSRH